MTSFFFCLALCVCVIFSNAQAQEPEKAELTSLSGTVEVLLEGAGEYTDAQEGMVLEAGDEIKTSASSSAELSFNEQNTNLVRLNENTSARISFSGDEKLEMTEGEVFSSISELPEGSAFEIRTPTVVSGARGTDWVTKVTEEGTDVEGLDNVAYVRHFNPDGRLSEEKTSLSAGEMTTVRKFQKPMPLRPVLEARRKMWQEVKQGLRRRGNEAVSKRQERAPFNRQDFLRKIKEQRAPDKSGANPPKPFEASPREKSAFQPKGERKTDAGFLRGREGKENKPGPPRPSQAGPRERVAFQPQGERKDGAVGRRPDNQGYRPKASGQPQSGVKRQANQGKPAPKKALTPKLTNREGRHR